MEPANALPGPSQRGPSESCSAAEGEHLLHTEQASMLLVSQPKGGAKYVWARQQQRQPVTYLPSGSPSPGG